MDADEFDQAVIRAVFDAASLRGWRDTSVAEAAAEAGLDLARVRGRFASRNVVLLRFGLLADAAALAAATSPGTPREKLFDMLMNRIETLQAHRPGVLALMNALPSDPAASLVLYTATLSSMRWLLEAAGVPVSGPLGALRVHGLLAAWLYMLRAWQRDDSPDLAGTMAAADRALDRAMQAERSLPFGARPAEPPPEPPFEPPPFEPAPFDGAPAPAAGSPLSPAAEPPAPLVEEPPTVALPDDLPGSSPTII